jgi:hypothetical protein
MASHRKVTRDGGIFFPLSTLGETIPAVVDGPDLMKLAEQKGKLGNRKNC